jgi:peptidoglycan/xylan/chitin deacetylase (PgdA/CDA1 family)
MHTILTYHSISSPPEPLPADADVSPEKFEAHLRWLAAHRRVVPLGDVLAAPARARLVAVTFDDGFRDNLTAALPLLEQYRTPATIFVTAGFVGREGYLTEGDVRELAAHPLITVGAHGLHHRHFARLTADEARHELRESRRVLEAITGRTVDLMAWPYGECNAELERMSAACGYRAAWSVWHGRNTSHSLWRVPLSRYDTLPRFMLKVSRAYFPVKRLLRPPLSAESAPQAEGVGAAA